ncbi:hypothetical protein L1887_31978 [Cichorium endivia]|nr:hypothetical protein L1887_31978 [Cichorium endivia]
MLFLVRSNPLALSKSDSSIVGANVAVSGLVTGTFLHLKLSTNSPSEVGDLVGFYRLPPSKPEPFVGGEKRIETVIDDVKRMERMKKMKPRPNTKKIGLPQPIYINVKP